MSVQRESLTSPKTRWMFLDVHKGERSLKIALKLAMNGLTIKYWEKIYKFLIYKLNLISCSILKKPTETGNCKWYITGTEGRQWETPLNIYTLYITWQGTPVAQLVQNLPTVQETLVQVLGQEDPCRRNRLPIPGFSGFPRGSDGEESACNAGDLGWIPGLSRSPGEGSQSMGSQNRHST